tara:strand:- start:33 stop:593 length:561 start_codon:yes stop_codon:yes gene_type:complete
MDLKELLNQTTIGKSDVNCGDCDDCDDSNDSNSIQDYSETTDIETSNSTQEPEPDNSANLNTSYNELEDEVEKETINPRFTQPWNKLDKGVKMNRLLLFIQSQKEDNELSDQQTKDLKNLLFKGCETGLFNKISDVKYDTEKALIESIKQLEFNESSKKYKLKTGGTKNRSVSKSRSNIDRLTKKK